MANRPRLWRDTIAAIESDDARAQTREVECERGSEARELMTWLPHAYNHPELKEKVLLHYIVSEFLESLELYSTLAVFGREACFDQQHYTEYHPIMGVEWFLKSFFMGDKYKGLLPVLLRFIKSAEKRVTERTKRQEYLDKAIEEAQQYLELPEERLAVTRGGDLSLRRGGYGNRCVGKSLRNPSRGTCSQPGCNREVDVEDSVALPSSFLYGTPTEGNNAEPNVSHVNIGVVSSPRSVLNRSSLRSSSSRQPIPEEGSLRNDHPTEPLNLRKTILNTRKGQQSNIERSGEELKSFPIEEGRRESGRNRPESPILDLHKHSPSTSKYPADSKARQKPNNNPIPRRSRPNLLDSILALEEEAMKIIDLPTNTAGPSGKVCPISSKSSSAAFSRKSINETEGTFATTDQPIDLTNSPPSKSQTSGTCPIAMQKSCARRADSNQAAEPTRNSVKTSCPLSPNGPCHRQSGNIIPIESTAKAAAPHPNSQSIHETTRLPVEYEQNPNLVPFGPEERPVGWHEPEDEPLVPYGPMDIYEHLQQATKEIEDERYDYIYLDYMREKRFKADKEAWLAERARKAAEEEARKKAREEREEREERARRAALADSAFYNCKFSDKRCMGRKRANSIEQEQKVAINKQNVTFHEALEGIELKDDFKNKYLPNWKRRNPLIVVDEPEGGDVEGNETGRLGSSLVPKPFPVDSNKYLQLTRTEPIRRYTNYPGAQAVKGCRGTSDLKMQFAAIREAEKIVAAEEPHFSQRIPPSREQEDKDDEVIRKINEMLRVTYQPRIRPCLGKKRIPKGY